MSDAEVRLAGEKVVLLSERALFWPRTDTLVAADFHWGKGAAFRAAGIPVPVGATSDDLARLDAALLRTCARRLVVLGDLFHAGRAVSRPRPWPSCVAGGAWPSRARDHAGTRQPRPPCRRSARRPADQLRERARPSFRRSCSATSRPTQPTGYSLAGHLHPGIVLAGAGLQRERLPCSGSQPHRGPARVRWLHRARAGSPRQPDDRIFVIAENDVIPVGWGAGGRGSDRAQVGRLPGRDRHVRHQHATRSETRWRIHGHDVRAGLLRRTPLQ